MNKYFKYKKILKKLINRYDYVILSITDKLCSDFSLAGNSLYVKHWDETTVINNCVRRLKKLRKTWLDTNKKLKGWARLKHLMGWVK